MKSVNRRLFLKTSAVGALGAVVTPTIQAGNGLQSIQTTGTVIRRKLGKTGIEVPIVSMGVGGCNNPVVVKGAMKLGINHFDTAHNYQGGNSERMLGEVLKEFPRNSFTIATKVKPSDTKEEFIKTFNESLERLQMDFVDILYLHSVNNREEAFNEPMLKAMKEIKAQGKAKHLGLSTHRNEHEVLQAAIDNGTYEVVLLAINFKQEHYTQIKEKMALAAEAGIGMVGMKVMAGGYLDKEKTKPVNYKAALKYVLQDPNLHTTIPSLNNLEQLQDNASVLTDINLSDQEKSDLEIASLKMGLYCNGCSQCIDSCGKKLNIPDLMRAYMYTYGYGETTKAKELVTRQQYGPNPCANCSECTVQCTKDFAVSQRIADISRLTLVPDEFLA
jgi:uncharacterized protein